VSGLATAAGGDESGASKGGPDGHGWLWGGDVGLAGRDLDGEDEVVEVLESFSKDVLKADEPVAGVLCGEDAGVDEAITVLTGGKGGLATICAVRDEEDRLEKNLRTGDDVVALYRLMNAPQSQRDTIASDMGRAVSYRPGQPYGRQYVAWWETRNLRIAANIRSTLQKDPKARVLSIIGATHKGYLDAYLDMMQDIRIVDAEQFLK